VGRPLDGAKLSPFPHLSWLTTTIHLRAGIGPTGIHVRSVAHSVSMPVTGRYAVRWICRGREQTWVENPGTIHFRPRNGEDQDFVIHPAESGDVLACFIPVNHLEQIARAEDVGNDVEWKRLLIPHDTVIERALRALAACREAPQDSPGRPDEASRRLVLRLVELSGGGRPDWHDDASVFESRTLDRLIEYIDAHLKIAPSLADTGLLVGLSPSHFAKKFRHSTGLSLHRFINRRRIRAALQLLKDQSHSISAVALDLGFSSQSHLTREFSRLTGMTPAKYRRQSRRTVG